MCSRHSLIGLVGFTCASVELNPLRCDSAPADLADFAELIVLGVPLQTAVATAGVQAALERMRGELLALKRLLRLV